MKEHWTQRRGFYYPFTALLFLGACAIAIWNWEVNGAILYAYLTALLLLLSPRLTDAMLPAMLLSVFVTRCYDSADLFFSKLPLIIPVILAIGLHFILYRNNYRNAIHLGPSFYGLCAVAVAVTLGGLGTISNSDYFSGGALFYVFGLGIGMVLFYLIVKGGTDARSREDVARIMYAVGLLACFCVLRFWWEHLTGDLQESSFADFQSKNNLATFLMLAMPFPLLYATKRPLHLLSLLLMYVCLILTGSRGGLTMGTVEFLMLILVTVCSKGHSNGLRISSACLGGVSLTALVLLLPRLLLMRGTFPASVTQPTVSEVLDALRDYLLHEEVRVDMFYRMLEDFQRNPLFGVGIGYTGNTDLYNPVKGAMNWYHMWIAQVVGGLGLAGILAYGYQLIHRVVIFFRHRDPINTVFLLSYLGLFLMSQVNPGEFCPMPYAALAMTYFALMEEEFPKKKNYKF